MKTATAKIKNLFNQEVILKGFILTDDLNNNQDLKVRFYENENDQDFFLIKKDELILN